MSSLTATTALDYLRDNGMVTLFAKPHQNEGPIAFIFEPTGTHPGADIHETFAVAATLSQNGKTLAIFKAVAIDTMRNVYNDKHETKAIETLSALPQVSTYEDLGKAFGLFYLTCWKLSWDAMEPIIPAKDDYKAGDWLNSMGYMNIFHSGLFNHLERQFFHQNLPDDKLREEILEDDDPYTTLCHPHGIHPLCSVFAGMGYHPNLEDHKGALGMPYTYHKDVLNEVTRLTQLYWAARNRDIRLEPFRF